MMGAVAAPTALALLREGMALLQAAGPAAARREAEWLLAGVLGVGRFDVCARIGNIGGIDYGRYTNQKRLLLTIGSFTKILFGPFDRGLLEQ